jgi:hypothetical protein
MDKAVHVLVQRVRALAAAETQSSLTQMAELSPTEAYNLMKKLERFTTESNTLSAESKLTLESDRKYSYDSSVNTSHSELETMHLALQVGDCECTVHHGIILML